MASLYRKPVMVTDPATGQKVKQKSKKWWGQYKDADGLLRRKPLAVDKTAAQAMLNEIVRRVEREKAGLVDPTEEQRKLPLSVHLKDFESYLANRDVTPACVHQTLTQVQRMIDDRRWKMIADITAGGALEFLGGLRRRHGLSAQTHNHYLKSARQFTRWLVRDGRTPMDPLAHLSRLNVQTDRRHERRVLSAEEFRRLVEAARAGKRIQGVSGPDRAMIYVLAAWTGFRRSEIGSLTIGSLRLDDDPPTATIEACNSKHRRRDIQVLHPGLVRQLKAWLATKKVTRNEPLFRLFSRGKEGKPRFTGRMVSRDLTAARNKWIEEADSKEEKKRRLDCDFLCFCNHDGLYADFHSLRHLFITNLARAGVSPAMAQTLARHADIRLTMGVYTHIERKEQTAAIASLPAPPAATDITPPPAPPAATENETKKTPQLRVYREEERDGQDSAA